MDGFAVSSASTTAASPEKPLTLCVQGRIAAGNESPIMASGFLLSDGSVPCVEIMTSARFPLAFFGGPFDAYVKVEDTVIVKGSDGTGKYIQIKKPATRHQNRRFQGSDFKYDDPIVCQGMTVKPHYVMALAMIGVEENDVYRRLRVGVISTGSELESHKSRIRPDASQIRDINSPYIQTVLEGLGVEVVNLDIVGDNPAEFHALLSICVTKRKFHVIISMGAVSMGKYDFVGAAIQAMGANINTAFFGLPGKPLASAYLRFLVITSISYRYAWS